MTTPEPDLGTRWCPTCRRRVRVTEESLESYPTRFEEVEVAVSHLACGHDTQAPNGRTHRYDLYPNGAA